VIARVPKNTDVFVSQEDLTLSTGGPSLGTWIGVSEFVAGFDIDMSTLRDGTEESIREGTKGVDGVP